MSRNSFLGPLTLVSVFFCTSGFFYSEANSSESGEFREARVEADEVLKRLLEEEDTDHDKKITVDDNIGDKQFTFTDRDGQKLSVNGTAALSQLLQELTLARDKAEKPAVLSGARVFENPVIRISRLIRERYWDNLTRRIDTEHPEDLLKILQDEKVHSGSFHYLYVPFQDEEAFQYFQRAEKQLPSLRLKRLPERVTADYVADLGKQEQHGLLVLALEKTQAGGWRGVPYVVPGGRFNEMYGWDSYFESLGLIVDGRVELAQAMVDNFVYQIEHYGKILNANRTYYLMRSQPPFLTSMIRAVYAELPKNPKTKQWLSRSLKAAMAEYKNTWMGPERLTSMGLSHYAGTGKGIPPEVEPGHFAQILKPYAQQKGLTLEQFELLYKAGKISEPALDSFFLHDQAVRESGHDTTYRWRVEGRDRCAEFVTVDLNALLYKIELDIGQLINTEFNDHFPDSPDPGDAQSKAWFERAKKRKALILKYLWDPQKSIFFDYDYVRGRRSEFLSATSLYPLWAWDPDLPDTKILTEKEAAQLVHKVLREIEMPGGVAGSSLAAVPQEQTSGDSKAQRQWDYPYGWAPHQTLIWEGLQKYHFKEVADRLIYKWLYTVARNAADYNGTIPEKFNVVTRSHQVFAEYGNVGTKFSYMTREGFGWMNASFQVGLKRLSPKWQTPLKNLVPPEWLEWNEQGSL